MSEIDQFRNILLKHARAPRFTTAVNEATGFGSCTNPLCGDRVEVTVKVERGQIGEICAKATGCSMAVASASMMCELLEGRAVNEAEELRTQLQSALVSDRQPEWPCSLAPLLPLSHLRQSPARIPCALMGWFALKEALGGSPR